MKVYIKPKIVNRELEVRCYLLEPSPASSSGEGGQGGDGWAKQRSDEPFDSSDPFATSDNQEFSGSLWDNL